MPILLITSNPEGGCGRPPLKAAGDRIFISNTWPSLIRTGADSPKAYAPKTGLRPVFGLAHQSAFDRIAMHVVQLLDALALRPDIKIVETAARFMRVRNSGQP